MAPLLLFTRSGCCLCEGLEERLRSLDPPVPFTAVDVDSDPALQGRWGLEVPVLARCDEIAGTDPDTRPQPNPHAASPLPRVPPRLAGERLRQWLGRHGAL